MYALSALQRPVGPLPGDALGVHSFVAFNARRSTNASVIRKATLVFYVAAGLSSRSGLPR
eukprot:9628764-Karenia_brevis.AAC.1